MLVLSVCVCETEHLELTISTEVSSGVCIGIVIIVSASKSVARNIEPGKLLISRPQSFSYVHKCTNRP